MNQQEFAEKFKPLSTQKKIKFIHSNINSLTEEGKISVLLSIIEEGSSSPTLRATALKLLGKTSCQDFKVVHECLEDKNPAVTKAAKKALENLESIYKENRQISQSVLKKIEAVNDKQKRLKMIKTLTKGKEPWICQALLDALEDPSEEIRNFIVSEFIKQEYLNLDLVYQKLLSPLWYVKSSALRLLSAKKNPESIKHIQCIVEDPNVDVRRSAALALGEIGGKEVLALLVQLAKDKNLYVRVIAEKALRKVSKLRFS